MFVVVTLLVFVLVWFKPRNLTFDKESHLKSPQDSPLPLVIRQGQASKEAVQEVIDALEYFIEIDGALEVDAERVEKKSLETVATGSET